MCQNFGVVGVGLCFLKKLLLKVSQNLQENTCAGVSQMQDKGLQIY